MLCSKVADAHAMKDAPEYGKHSIASIASAICYARCHLSAADLTPEARLVVAHLYAQDYHALGYRAGAPAASSEPAASGEPIAGRRGAERRSSARAAMKPRRGKSSDVAVGDRPPKSLWI